MTPLKDFRGVFSSFAVSYVRYIINMYSIVNVTNSRRPYGTVLYGTPRKGLPHDFHII